MNINYDEIITKANERKVVLQNIVATLRDAEEILRQDARCHRVAHLPERHVQRLDDEGRCLLPEREREALYRLNYTIGRASEVLHVSRCTSLASSTFVRRMGNEQFDQTCRNGVPMPPVGSTKTATTMTICRKRSARMHSTSFACSPSKVIPVSAPAT